MGAQKQLDTASHFVLIFARKNVTAHTEYVQHLLRGVKNMKKVQFQLLKINLMISKKVSISPIMNEHCMIGRVNKHILLANMMTSAALLGIDSCPIEGFDLDKVTEILSDEGVLDTEQFGISVMVGFGYRAQEPKHGKVRQNEDDIISWIE